MAGDSSVRTPDRLVTELSEDIAVAIREFTERYPDMPSRWIGRALRQVERRMEGGWLPRLRPPLALLAALVAGIVLGLALR